VGIFLPAFLFVAASGPLVRRIRTSKAARAAIDGLNAASLSLMAVVCWQLAREAIVDWPSALLSAAAAVALVRWGVNSALLVVVGAMIGLLLRH
jgi:chromate transporter